ncbi:hypothetical protein Tco_1027423 [Tanacetum coccineum]
MLPVGFGMLRESLRSSSIDLHNPMNSPLYVEFYDVFSEHKAPSNALRYSIFRCHPDLGVLQIGIRAKVIENQATMGTPYAASRPTIWITLPGPEEPQTPPVPQDEDEREPMFITTQILISGRVLYAEYLPLEDMLLCRIQTRIREYKDDGQRMVTVGLIPWTGEIMEMMMMVIHPGRTPMMRMRMKRYEIRGMRMREEEHLAPADSAVVVPTVELVSLPGGTEPVIPPPSIDITTTGARITVQL